jgi:integrase
MATKRRGNGEGTISQRKDGRWQARVTLPDGTRKTIYARTRAEASRELTALRRSLDIGMPVRRDERLPLSAYLADWMARVRPTVKPLTWQRYQELLRGVPETMGRTALAKLTPSQVERLYANRLAAGLSPTTVHQLHSVLHHALADGVRKGVIARNVCDLVDAPRPNRAQVQALTTGLRQGELLALHWAEVDLEAGITQVRGTLHRVPGASVALKSGLLISDPKTSHSRRPVRLSALAVSALRTHRVRQNEERLAMGEAWHDLDLVFTNSIGRPCEARNVIRKSYKPLLERAGVPYVKFHALRHSAATLLLAQGIHPAIVMQMLGHSTISMTVDTYSHVTLDMQQPAADAMDRLFG